MCCAVPMLTRKNIILMRIFQHFSQSITDELHIMCVLYTEEISGVLTLEYDEEGNLEFRTEALESDAMYDEIGSVLRIKQLRAEKKELLESLELYYRVFFLGEDAEESLKEGEE